MLPSQSTLPWRPSEPPVEVEGTHAKLLFNHAVQFMLAGKAVFTLRSTNTRVRYTYKIRKKEDESGCRPTVWFVSLLTGNDNDSDYTYMGVICASKFKLTQASKYSAISKPVIAFKWVWERLTSNIEPHGVEIWHAGRCGRCGRHLTVPESIELGYGPECLGTLGF